VTDDLDADDGLGGFPSCPVCGIPLTPRQVTADGHPTIDLYCPDHGVQQTWRPFEDGA